MQKFYALTLVLALLLSLATGCTVGSDTGATQSETTVSTDGEATSQTTAEEDNTQTAAKVLRWGTSSAPSGVFNPLLTTDAYNYPVTAKVFDSLLDVSPDYVWEPRLATSYDLSDDQLSITLHLRDDVKWHDGETFDADDVKFTLEFIAHPDYAGTLGNNVSALKGYEAFHSGAADSLAGVEVIDPYTVKVSTETPYAPIIASICSDIFIIPEHIWSQVDIKTAENETELLRNPVGTGPFVMGEFVPDQYVTLVKNQDYWGGEVKLDQIIIQAVNIDTVAAMMAKGELDYMTLFSLDPEEIAFYEDNDLIFEEMPETAYQMMVVNTQREILSDKYVRQAFMYAINRQAIVESLIYNFGVVGTQVFPPNFWAFPGDDVLNDYAYSPENAIKVLTENAGWEYKDDIMYKDGEPVKLTLLYPSGNKARELSAPVIQENFKQIGIDLEIQMMEFKTLLEQINDEDPDAFDLCLIGMGVSLDGDASRILHSDSIFNGLNFARYSNPEMDSLLESGLSVLDRDQRKAIYKELAILDNQELPYVYLYNFSTGIVMSSKLKNWQKNVYNVEYNIADWDIE